MSWKRGADFLSGCTGSSVWARHQTLEQGHCLLDTRQSTTLGAQLSRIGYTGSRGADCYVNPLSCHLELHIEQNRRLQDSGSRAGVVTGIQGIRWFRVHVRGEQGHAGSTPMAGRADAFLATAKIEVLLDSLARENGAVATVGMIEHGRRGVALPTRYPVRRNSQ